MSWEAVSLTQGLAERRLRRTLAANRSPMVGGGLAAVLFRVKTTPSWIVTVPG